MLSPRFLVIACVLSCQTVLTGFAQTEARPVAPKPATPVQEITLHKWSGDLNVPDPVACAVDPQGRVYVAATTRRKVGDLDIREHRQWIPNDVALDSVENAGAAWRPRRP